MKFLFELAENEYLGHHFPLFLTFAEKSILLRLEFVILIYSKSDALSYHQGALPKGTDKNDHSTTIRSSKFRENNEPRMKRISRTDKTIDAMKLATNICVWTRLLN